MDIQGKQLLKPKEAAWYLSISPRHLQRLREIPRVPIGTDGFRFHVQDLEKWIAKQKAKASGIDTVNT